MSWFDATGFANLAKNALKEAQKTLDKALVFETENEGTEAHDDTKQVVDIHSATNSLWETFTNTLLEKPRGDEKTDEIKDHTTDVVISQQPTSTGHLSFTDQEQRETDVGEQSDTVNVECETGNLNIDTCRLTPDSYSNTAITSKRLSVESDSRFTVSSESVEVLGSTSTTTPESETDVYKIKSHDSYESSVEVLSSSSVEVLSSVEEPSISSDSIEVINKANEETSDECSLGDEDNSYTSPSENTLTAFEFYRHPLLKDVLKSSSSFETFIADVPSVLNSPAGSYDVCQLSDLTGVNSQLPTKDLEPYYGGGSYLIDNKLSNELSKSNENRVSSTVDGNSSCDGSTIVGADEVTRESESSICSLKSILAEAITDHNMEDAFSSRREESPSSIERTKVGSSDHTSGDELETATSSDIEIISNPNGDSSNTNSRQSPAKLIYRSSNGKMSVIAISDNLIPEISGKYVSFKMSGHNGEPSETSSGCSDDSGEIDRLLKKIGELSETLEARESKLIDLSMKNAELSENNSNLKSQLECQMNEEFSQRLASLEKKFQQAIREKDALRKQLETCKQTAENADEMKDQIIKELREEGEKLSKQQLSANVLIKKLRTTEKDHLKLISSLREQYDGLMTELERTKRSLSAKESVEKTQIETINQLTKSNQKLEKQLNSLQSQIDNLTSTLVSLQREQQEKDASLTELSKKLDDLTANAKEETIQNLEEELIVTKNKQKELQSVISELRQTLRSAEYRYSSQEAALRQENAKLLLSVEEYKMMHENLQEQIVETTKPLSKQLTDEVSKYHKAVEIWQRKEHNLNQTISELRDKLEDSEILNSRHKQQYDKLAKENDRYARLLEEQRKKMDDIKDKLRQSSTEVDQLKTELERLTSDSRIVKDSTCNSRVSTTANVSTQANIVEKIHADNDTAEYNIQEDQFDFQESPELNLNETSRSTSPTLSVARSELSSSMWPTFGDDEAGSSISQIGDSIYDGCSKPIATATSLIENMQAQIKQREGEIQQLQWELHRRDHERVTLIDEVSRLTAKLDELKPTVKNFEILQRQYDELLQMYGEKAESYRELQMDMEDIKEIHKLQITQLIDKSSK